MQAVFSETVFRLVFDDEFRASFMEDPKDFQERYELTDADMEIITTYDLNRINECCCSNMVQQHACNNCITYR